MFNEYAYLYVEDDDLSREALQMVLTYVMGVECLYVFEDSTDFMNRVQGLPRKPDLILLDIHMRPVTGFTMLEMLRSHPEYKDTRVVALTASVMNEEVSLLRQSGFNGVIAKPIDIERMPDLIGRILHGEPIWYITE